MQFDSISAFFDMGGYGFFVWLSYGVSALLLLILWLNSQLKNKAVKQQIAQKIVREQKLRQAAKLREQSEKIQQENDSNEVLS